MNKFGPSSIAADLRWTRQAALNARLLLNDYGLEGDDPQITRKRRSLLTLIEALQQSPPDLDNGAATLELMPPLALKAQVLRIRDRQIALAFNQPDGDAAVTLLYLT